MAKYKVVGTVINEAMELIGLIIKAKEKDISGGFSDNEIEVPKSIQDLQMFNGGAGFRNYQITVTKNGFNEIGTFKLNSLPMVLFNKNTNSYLEVRNGIELTAKVIQGKETVGFRVRFADGREAAYTYPNVVQLATWFRPMNFSVRTRFSEDGKTKKSYVSGNGIKLSDLPATTSTGGNTDENRTHGKSVQQAKRKDNSLSSDFDILDVYDIICNYHGQVIKLPGEKYIPASYDRCAEEGKFVPLGIGEVASPKLMFNATKLNVNAGFKKVGYVPVNIHGISSNITTFTYATKSIFIAGENYIKTFGIAVPAENEVNLVSALGKSLALEKITDNAVIQPLSSVIDANNLVFYKVTSNNLELISSGKIKDSMMNAQQLYDIHSTLFKYKLMSKALGIYGELGEIKKEYGDNIVAQAFNTKPSGNMALYGPDVQMELQKLGFNIYTGAYTERLEKTPKKNDPSSKSVEIAYSINAIDPSKFTGKQIKQIVMNIFAGKASSDSCPLSSELTQQLLSVYQTEDPAARAKAAKTLADQYEAKINEINKRIWMHNAAQFIVGKKAYVHVIDSKDWEFVKALKTGEVYRNTKVEGLTVKVSGVLIPR